MNALLLIDDTKDADATNNHQPKEAFKPLPTPTQIAKMKEAVADGKSEAVEKALAKYNVTAELRKQILG